MPIQPETQEVIPAIPEKTIDTYWLKRMSIDAPDLTLPVRVLATLLPFNSTTGESYPDLEVQMILEDVLNLAANQPELANTVNVIFNEIQRQARLQDLI